VAPYMPDGVRLDPDARQAEIRRGSCRDQERSLWKRALVCAYKALAPWYGANDCRRPHIAVQPSLRSGLGTNLKVRGGRWVKTGQIRPKLHGAGRAF